MLVLQVILSALIPLCLCSSLDGDDGASLLSINKALRLEVAGLINQVLLQVKEVS